ncbi:MAG: metal-dependent hydrolase [Betaproteobacteria bacterium]|nr:metal-dependent hydrolase [Betaproteobacteria bacterium]
MNRLEEVEIGEDLAGAWFECNLLLTSFMEAISFVTPELEQFMVRAVAAELPGQSDSELRQRCLDFIREEAMHSKMHGKLNTSLLNHLGRVPPGLAAIGAAMTYARKHFASSRCLGLSAATEHLTAAVSGAYLLRENEIHIQSPFVKTLFNRHAHEEISHRAVVFDLWRVRWTTARMQRALSLLSVVVSLLFYLALAVPWVLYRKTGNSKLKTLGAICRCVDAGRLGEWVIRLPTMCFPFIRSDYHPDHSISTRVGLSTDT